LLGRLLRGLLWARGDRIRKRGDCEDGSKVHGSFAPIAKPEML
jgi:hypothetical protein